MNIRMVMVLFDFDTVIERKNTTSVKWEQVKQVFGEEGVLPMWVADMDFNPPHEVAEAIKKRVEHEILGYAFVPDSTAEAIQAWLKKRHNWDIPRRGSHTALALCRRSAQPFRHLPNRAIKCC